MNLPAVILIMCYANACYVQNVKRMQNICVYHNALDFRRHNTNEKLHFRFALRNLDVIYMYMFKTVCMGILKDCNS